SFCTSPELSVVLLTIAPLSIDCTLPPLKIVPTARPPDETAWMPLLTNTALLATPPASITCSPVALTIVPIATPPDWLYWNPPAPTVTPLALPCSYSSPETRAPCSVPPDAT